jgi:hypothetical protein
MLAQTPNVMDALRIHDGLPVAIKATLGWTREASIAFLFTDGNAIEEPRNHCVPILDTFIEEDIVYLVMPLLRAFNDPTFVTVAEVIDFVDQMVQVGAAQSILDTGFDASNFPGYRIYA